LITGPEHGAAARIATAAGEALVALRRRIQGDGSNVQAVRAAGDRTAHELIVQALAAAYPQDPILSEEGLDNRARLGCRRVWIVDPLDGTREFGEVERTDWAVHVALIVDGMPVAGAVALPARHLTLSTASPPRLPPRDPGAPRIVISRSRPPTVTPALAARLQAELMPLGSAGAKTMAVVLGEADIYVHAGGQYEWDSAAPVAVAAAAGLHVSRLDGAALRYNQADPWLPDQLICRQELATEVLDALKAVSALAT
jgi:3'(2'), 5'-bisphosphate nucleotidase